MQFVSLPVYFPVIVIYYLSRRLWAEVVIVDVKLGFASYDEGVRTLRNVDLGHLTLRLSPPKAGVTEPQPDTDTQYLIRAHALYNRGEYQAAIAEFDELIRRHPERSVPYAMRGNAYAELGQNERAIQDFNQAICLDPDLPDNYRMRGLSYAEVGQWQNAVEDFRLSVLIHKRLGQLDEIIGDFGRYISHDPPNILNYFGRGTALVLSGRYEEAIRDFTRANQLSADADKNKPIEAAAKAYIYSGRARAEIFLDQDEQAIEDLSHAINLNPEYEEAYATRALAYTFLGLDKEAEKDIATAIQRGFDSVTLYEWVKEAKELRSK